MHFRRRKVSSGLNALALALGAGLAATWTQPALAREPGDSDVRLAAEKGGGIVSMPRIPLLSFAPRNLGLSFIAEVGSLFNQVKGRPAAVSQDKAEPGVAWQGHGIDSDLGASGWSVGFRDAFRGRSIGMGGELPLDAHFRLGRLELAATPRAAWASSGVRLGGTAGLALDLGRFKIGYDLDLIRNVAIAPGSDNLSFKVLHGVGSRLLVSRDVAIQGNAYFTPADFSGNQNFVGSLEVTYRFRGTPVGLEPGYPAAVAAI